MDIQRVWKIIDQGCPHLENLLVALCNSSQQSPIVDPDEKAWQICRRNLACYPEIPNPSWDVLDSAERDQRFTNSHCISLMNDAKSLQHSKEKLVSNIRYTIRHFFDCNSETQVKLENLFISAVNISGCNCFH